MKKIYCILMIPMLVAVLLFSGCSPASKPQGEENTVNDEMSGKEDEINDKWAIIEDAYIFAFPLVLLNATAKNSTNTIEQTNRQAPVNQLMHAENLANADTRFVVTPNVDTVYTQVHFDLSEDAMVYKKPAADRFFSVELMDAYTNCVRLLGTGADTQEENIYLIAGPDFGGKVPDGMELVEIPTNNAWMLARTIVDNNDDLKNVYAIQNAMELVPLSAYGHDFTPPKGTFDEKNNYVPIEHVLSMTPEEFFSIANELMVKNPPAAHDKEIVQEMKRINVGAGLKFDSSILGEGTAKWREMLSGLAEKLTESSAPFMEKMGIWQFWGEPIAEFKTEYDYRALVALGGLGANPVSIAVYPKAAFDDDNQVLNGKNSYTMHFDSVPKVNEYGFWSVTAYGEDNFLIDNELDRYAINDRSKLKLNSDGSFDILLQVEPPEDKTMMENWLPVKAEQFHLYLRIYLPDNKVLNGEWAMPGIKIN